MAEAQNQAATAGERILPLTLKPHIFEWHLNGSKTKKNLTADLKACKLSMALRTEALRDTITKLAVGHLLGARVAVPLDGFRIGLIRSGENGVVAKLLKNKCMSQRLMELVTKSVDAPGVDPTENLRRNGLANLIDMLRSFIVREMAMTKKDRKRAADTGGEYDYKGNPLLGDTIAERE